MVSNNIFENKFKDQKILGAEIFFERNCGSKKNFDLKKNVKKNLGLKEIFGLKTLGPNKLLCLEKVLSKDILVHKNYDPKKLGQKCLVKIRPVTAEILLIWTNVTTAYVAWKNVTITVGIF